jgi:hypothetical protein
VELMNLQVYKEVREEANLGFIPTRSWGMFNP